MAASRGDWWDWSWNPVYGCSAKSPGCTHCYAVPFTRRIAGRTKDPRIAATLGKHHFSGQLHVVEEAIDRPVHWRRPRTIFVCSMTDVGEPEFPQDVWGRMLNIMLYKATQHTYLILTKRPDVLRGRFPHRWPERCWVGTSAETQEHFDHRWEDLRRIDAATRWVSAEPLLGSIAFEDRGRHPSERSFPRWVVVGVESRGGKVGRLGLNHQQDANAYAVADRVATWYGAAERTVKSASSVGAAVFVKQIPSWEHGYGKVLHARNAEVGRAAWPALLQRWEFPG